MKRIQLRRLIAVCIGLIAILTIVFVYNGRAKPHAATSPASPPPPSLWSNERTPTFADFAVGEKFTGVPAKIDYVSSPLAGEFKTAIAAGVRQGANFAGHYRLVELGCGTSCQTFVVVDLTDGKVYDGGTAERGIEYHADSKLAVFDPPYGPDVIVRPDDPLANLPVRYSVWHDNRFEQVWQIITLIR